MRRLAALLLIFIAAGIVADGLDAAARRNSRTVRRERTEHERRSRRTQRQIQVNIEQTERELARFEHLQARIAESEARIAVLQPRVDSLNRRSRALADSVEATTARVERLRAAYGESLRSIRRLRQISSPAAFIFASESFGQAWRRLRYLRELAQWNRGKGLRLKAEKERLEAESERLDSVRARRERALADLRRRREALQRQSAESERLIASLRSQSGNLNRIFARQQQQAQELDRELERVIEEEAEAARRAEEERLAAERRRREAEERATEPSEGAGPEPEPSPAPAPSPAPSVPVALENLTEAFEAARGTLPMPVSGNAVVVNNFGRRAHAEFSHVEVQSNGVDIDGAAGARAKAVFDGTVSMVIVMEGYRNVVILRHGEYLTVYAGIDDLEVRKGQTVRAGQTLGTVRTAPAGNTRLHFEVRHEKEKLDPQAWLR